MCLMTGVNGADGNGDIMMSENQVEFRKFVFENTDNKGLHFVMADGVSFLSLSTFSTRKHKNMQTVARWQPFL